MADFDGFEIIKLLVKSPAAWAAAIFEHQEVLQAIDTQSPQHARKAMQKHLRQAHKRYSASWLNAPSRS